MFSYQVVNARSYAFIIGAFLISLIALVGCAPRDFPERIDETYRSVEEKQRTFDVSKTEDAEWLSWKQALRLLKKRNLTYLRAQNALAELEDERKNFTWRQLDPRLRAVATLGAALDELSSLGSNDYGIRLLGTINIPSPTSYYASRYALELQYYQTILDVELAERRLVANLYAQFLQQEQLEQDRKDLTLSAQQEVGELAEKLASLERRELKELALRQRAERMRLALNRLLDTPGKHWVAVTRTAPDISYAGRLDELDPNKGYGRLALRQAAAQVEASLLRVLQVEMRKWPAFGTGLSLPTIYNSREDEDFDLAQTTLFTSLGKGIEFTGQEARAIEDAEFHAELIQRSLSQRMEAESSQLAKLKLDYWSLSTQKSRLSQEVQWLEANPPSGSGNTLVAHLEDLRKKRGQLREVTLRIRQLDLQFWVWDERYWEKN